MSKVQTVLVVDDDRLAQTTFKLLFEVKGYQVLLADDGNQALAQLARHHVDLALLDILMLDKDGGEALIEIERRLPQLHVYIMSGGGNQNKRELFSLAGKFGGAATLTRPLSPSEILDRIDADFPRAA